MRIISGLYKGRRLKEPPASKTRPTQDRVREALFSILSSHYQSQGDCFDDKVVLDAFAGSGALGLEALSRGAAQSFFFEKNKPVYTILLENIHHLKVEKQCQTYLCDALRLPKAPQKMDLVFLDPPYGHGLVLKTIEALIAKKWMDKGSLIVIEVSAHEDLALPPSFEVFADRAYGSTRIILACLKEFCLKVQE